MKIILCIISKRMYDITSAHCQWCVHLRFVFVFCFFYFLSTLNVIKSAYQLTTLAETNRGDDTMNVHTIPHQRMVLDTLLFLSISLLGTYNTWVGPLDVVVVATATIKMRYIRKSTISTSNRLHLHTNTQILDLSLLFIEK